VPAVTVRDITVLPRVVADANLRPRRVKSITTAPQGHEGEGFPVRRAFAGVDLADLDPFIHLDQMGEVIDGIFDHYDNHGGGGTISDGDTQWMTAGAGILHIETPPEHLVVSGGLFHGFQLWVNLPAAKKWSPPAYQNLHASDVALLSSSDGGALLRVIAGEVAGFSGPGTTQSPITLVHATLQPGSQLRLPWNASYNALAYVLNGFGTVGEEKHPIKTGQLVTYRDGDMIVISADLNQESRAPSMDVLILGGLPIKEPVAWMGPFVMNTKAEVLKAFDDFQKGVLGVVPPDWSKANRPLNRDGIGYKLGADLKGVHGTPDELQER